MGSYVIWFIAISALMWGGQAAYKAWIAPTRDSAGVAVDTGTVDPREGQPGDCVIDAVPDKEQDASSFKVVPCSKAHSAEIFWKGESNLAQYDHDRLTDEAGALCTSHYASYVGHVWQGTEFKMYYNYPSEGSWDREADRSVTCFVAFSDGRPHATMIKSSGL